MFFSSFVIITLSVLFDDGKNSSRLLSDKSAAFSESVFSNLKATMITLVIYYYE